MYIYLLTDDLGWFCTNVFESLDAAREAALDFMENPAWRGTGCMTIHRIGTMSKKMEDVEYVIHGAHRAEAHKVEDK